MSTQIDELIRHDINLIRLIKGHERQVEDRLTELQRVLVGLVANDYNSSGPNQDMISAGNALIDEAWDDIGEMVLAGTVEVGEYDLEKVDEIYG